MGSGSGLKKRRKMEEKTEQSTSENRNRITQKKCKESNNMTK
jgi:hypothetical protein